MNIYICLIIPRAFIHWHTHIGIFSTSEKAKSGFLLTSIHNKCVCVCCMLYNDVSIYYHRQRTHTKKLLFLLLYFFFWFFVGSFLDFSMSRHYCYHNYFNYHSTIRFAMWESLLHVVIHIVTYQFILFFTSN